MVLRADGYGPALRETAAATNFTSRVDLEVLELADDFVWILEDTPNFIAGRIEAALQRYNDQLLPPMFKALVNYGGLHAYAWCTPGHTGGTAFLKSPIGHMFFDYFGENLLRADLSISMGELGSLLDHSGPIGEGDRLSLAVSSMLVQAVDVVQSEIEVASP